MDKRIDKIREELSWADALGLIHPPYAASDVQYLVDEIATLQEREKVLIERLQSHGDVETDKEEALRGEEE